MQMTDLEVFKEIPGYKAILKAVLKSQIQSLVEQLSQQTGEESVIVTASLEDGSLTHLGSDFGKVFLDSHDEIKGQFLGFCLKRNQMMQKSMSHQLKNVRKKGPFGAGRRPRLAPYYTTTSSRKAPRKSTPRNIQSQQQMPLYDQNYTITQEPSQNQTEDFEQGTSNHLHTIVKTEPGLENEMGGEGTYSADNQIYIENVQSAFPYNSYHGDGDADATKFKEEVHGEESVGHSTNVEQTANESPASETGARKRKTLSPKTDLASFGADPGDYTTLPIMPSPEQEMSDRPVCTICNKRFKNERNLKFHMMTHSGVRPYACTYCPKRFSQKNVLDQHLLTHTGQKPFACSFCEKCFTQRATKYRHERRHVRDMMLN